MHVMNYSITTPSVLAKLLCDVRVVRMFGQAPAHPLKGIARGP